jgi:hypothetical protein
MHTSAGRRALRHGAHQCRAGRPSCPPRSRAADDRGPAVVCVDPHRIVAGRNPALDPSWTPTPRPAVTAAIQPEAARDGSGASAHPGG